MRIVEIMFSADGADQNVLVITDAPEGSDDRQAYVGIDRLQTIWGSIPNALGKEIKRLVPLTLEWREIEHRVPYFTGDIKTTIGGALGNQ